MSARFVLHDHARPRRHYDLRLEEDGVLRCWAVPKGLPRDPFRDHLAIATPDHDLSHLTRDDEDTGIADTGTWELHDRNERRFVFTLHGREESVRYALIHTGREWLVHRTLGQG